MSDLTREKSDLESRVEEDQDEIEEVTGKQRALISQNTLLQTQLAEAHQQVTELEDHNVTLESKVGAIFCQLFLEGAAGTVLLGESLYRVELLIKDTLNKGHFPMYRPIIVAIYIVQFAPKENNFSIMDKIIRPQCVRYLEVPLYKCTWYLLLLRVLHTVCVAV